jgi:hypothetical protein
MTSDLVDITCFTATINQSTQLTDPNLHAKLEVFLAISSTPTRRLLPDATLHVVGGAGAGQEAPPAARRGRVHGLVVGLGAVTPATFASPVASSAPRAYHGAA